MYMYEMIVNGSSHYKRAERVRELEDRGGGERDGTRREDRGGERDGTRREDRGGERDGTRREDRGGERDGTREDRGGERDGTRREDRGGERDGTKKAKLEKDPKRRSRSTVTSLHVLSPSPNTDVEMSPLDCLWRNLGRRLTVLSPIDPGLGGTSTVAVCHVLSRTLKSITHVQYKRLSWVIMNDVHAT